jgi:hypothetical protein
MFSLEFVNSEQFKGRIINAVFYMGSGVAVLALTGYMSTIIDKDNSVIVKISPADKDTIDKMATEGKSAFALSDIGADAYAPLELLRVLTVLDWSDDN